MTDQTLRVIEFLLWLAVLIVTTKPVWRLIWGGHHGLDAFWALVWFGATNRIIFTAINLWLPYSVAAREMAHVMAVVVASTVLVARYARVGEA